MGFAPYFAKAARAAASVLKDIDRRKLEQRLMRERIGLVWGNQAARSAEGRVALELVANLIARFYPRIALIAEGEGASTLSASLGQLVEAINPDVDMTSTAGDVTQAIVIGEVRTLPAAPRFSVGSDGWVFSISTCSNSSTGDSDNPFGAAASACLAVANVFRSIFSSDLPGAAPDGDLRASLLDLDPLNTDLPNPTMGEVDLGAVSLLGAGAIGEAALWTLRRMPTLRGTMEVIDPEFVDQTNLQRYLLCGMSDVGGVKVRVVAERFQTPTVLGMAPNRLCIDPIQKTWGMALASNPEPWKSRRILSALDSTRDRIAIQGSLPEVVINAWTQNGDLGLSVHDGNGIAACIACIYFPTGVAKSDDQLVAEAIRLPRQLMLVRELLYTGRPIGEDVARMIAGAFGLPPDELLPHSGQPLRVFYTDTVCAGVVVPLGGAVEGPEVPLAFQSALAGVMLAAAATAEAIGVSKWMHGSKFVIDVLRPFKGAPSVPLAKVPGGRCICQDPDVLATYRRRQTVGH